MRKQLLVMTLTLAFAAAPLAHATDTADKQDTSKMDAQIKKDEQDIEAQKQKIKDAKAQIQADKADMKKVEKEVKEAAKQPK